MNILMVTDYQEGFKDHRPGYIKDNILELINSKAFDYTFAFKFINTEYSSFVRYLKYTKMKETNKKEVALSDNIERKVDKVFVKNTYSAVTTEFVDYLSEIGKTDDTEVNIFIAGADTDACVLTTVSDLFNLGVNIIVLRSYCYTTGLLAYSNAAYKIIKRNFTKNVTTRKIKCKEDIADILNHFTHRN